MCLLVLARETVCIDLISLKVQLINQDEVEDYHSVIISFGVFKLKAQNPRAIKRNY